MAEQDLGSVLDSSTASINKLLQEDLSKDAIGFFAEDSAENDGDTVVAGLDIDSLLFTVVNCSDLTTFANTLRSSFGSVLGGLLVQGLVFVKGLLEGGSHDIALQQTESGDQVGAGFFLGG